MSVFVVFPFVMGAFIIATCHQPLDRAREMSSYIPSVYLEKDLLDQCQQVAQDLKDDNDRLRNEVNVLEMKVDALEEVIEGYADDEYEEEDGDSRRKLDSQEVGRASIILRKKRGAACEGGTLTAWACAPQCVFKLKGLCGLSLKNICHC